MSENLDSAIVNNDSGTADDIDICMETSDLLRHKIPRSLMARRTETVADAAINLWEQMAGKIISIVGEGGFNSLYTRSVYLTQSKFPWIAATSPSPKTDQRFAELRMSLEGQTPAQASEANSLLLITFTDILAALIGEELTTNILHLAWGNDASTSVGEEIRSE
jgi:hypothetical protein